MKEKIRDFFREVHLHARAYVILSVEAFLLMLAILLADIKQKAANKRYFVILAPVKMNKKGEWVYKLRSINNNDFERFKREGRLPKRMTFLELERKAFYATPLKKNNTYSNAERLKAKDRYLRYQKAVNGLV